MQHIGEARGHRESEHSSVAVSVSAQRNFPLASLSLPLPPNTSKSFICCVSHAILFLLLFKTLAVTEPVEGEDNTANYSGGERGVTLRLRIPLAGCALANKNESSVCVCALSSETNDPSTMDLVAKSERVCVCTFIDANTRGERWLARTA